MKKLFDRFKGFASKHKKLVKTIPILPMPFILSGCGNGYVHVEPGWFNGLDEYMESLEIWKLNFIQGLNSASSEVVGKVQGELLKSNTRLLDYLDGFTSFSTIINIVTILALVVIIINFARTVYKNYISNADTQYGFSTSELFKKLFIAFIAVNIIPYIFVSAYVGTSYAGVAVGNLFIDQEANGLKEIMETYQYMDEHHISFGTYCEGGQKAAGISKISDLNGSSSKKFDEVKDVEIITMSDSVVGVPNFASGQDPYDFWCGGFGDGADRSLYRNVWQSAIYSKSMSNLVTIGNPNIDNSGIGISSVLLKGVIQLATMVVIIIIAFNSFVAVARRTIDFVVLLGTSWYYIGASVCDAPQQNSIGELGKKLLALCLSHFIFCLEINIFIYTTLVNSTLNIWILFAWMYVLKSTPTAVQEMVISTGAQESAADKLGSGVSFVKGIFK